MSKRLTGVIPPMTTPFDRDGELVLKEVAAQVETISYEILTGLTPRLPRLERA